MAFVKAVINTKGGAAATGVKASLKKPRGAPASLVLQFSPEAIERFGWASGDKIEVLLGTEQDRGRVRLTPNRIEGQVELQRRTVRGGASYFVLALGHQPMFVDEEQKGSPCGVAMFSAKGVEITLPKWAGKTTSKAGDAVSTVAGHKMPDGPTVVVNHRGTGRPPKNVTASIMGDPSPERRAIIRQMQNAGA